MPCVSPRFLRIPFTAIVIRFNRTRCPAASLRGGVSEPARRRSAVATAALRIDETLFGFALLLAIAMNGVCFADVTKLPTEERKVLLDSSRFHEVHSTKDLPFAVIALCIDENGKLADPGQNWNATDVVTDATLPWKRLIWAAVGGDYYVVHYERGGIDHSFHILVAKLGSRDASPRVVWHGVGHQLKNYAAFVEALHAGTLDDRVNYPR